METREDQIHPLRKWRLETGLTQVALAALVDCTKATICRIEKGGRVASPDLMLRIAEVTRNAVTPNDLLFHGNFSERVKA